MSYDYYGIILIFILFIKSTYSCWNISLNNTAYGHVENLNFYLGKSQPKNQSCSWIINNEKQSYYVLSLRIIEIEYDQILWSNELILKTDEKEIILSNINQRTFYIPSSTLEIYFQTKSPKLYSNSLNIHRFFLEFINVNNYNYNNNDYFRCTKSGLIIPKQWKCNCLYECLDNDYSDEEDCPLCSIIKSSNSLLCHSNEIWCLPVTNQTDPKGICIPHEQNAQCSYSSNCETIISYSQDHGEIFLDNSMLSNRESLCFIIIAKEKHQIKLIINQYNFINQRPDLELFVYDGSEQQNQLLVSSNSLLMIPTVQTYQNHFATIVIRKSFIENQDFYIYQNDFNNILLNITWFTSVCSDDQILCNGHFETKCYLKEQRCDGIWDCISGDDELGCLPSSCPTTFACNDRLRLPSDQPRCYTWSERCNGNAFCINRADEQNCTNWWCNSNNGTFLCKNLNCIYETWVCDGADDCGDNSDEMKCPIHLPRRLVTAAVIGATVCCTLFLIALGFTCKLFHLRSTEQRTSSRLLNTQQYLEQRRLNRPSTAIDNTTDDARRVAPPSYNQTMGFLNDNEERHAILAEHLRIAGLTNLIPLTSEHRNRRHRRHRRHRRTRHEGSREALVETRSNRFNRFRSLFTRNLSINNNSIPSNEFNISEHHTSSIQPIILSNRELPPPYSEEQLSSIHHESDIQSSITTPINSSSSSSLIRIHKQQIPLNTIRNHLEEQPSSPPPIATIEDDEQASSNDDDDKMLVP